MSDDASYTSFLNQANESPSTTTQPQHSTSQSRSKHDPTLSASSSSSMPASLQSLPDTPYVSDTDSAWEPIFLNYASDAAPDLAAFKNVLKSSKGYGEDVAVEELSVSDFDPRGRYAEIVSRVASAGLDGRQDGGVQVFRVEVSSTRCEYYILTVGERKLVGVFTKAVES